AGDGKIGEHSGRKEVTVTATFVDCLGSLAPERDLASFLLREIDVELYFPQLGLAHDRALFSFFIERVALFQLRCLFDESLDEVVVGGALDEDTRATEANLALVRERRTNTAGDRCIEIADGINDVWIFNAQFEGNLL